MKKAKKTGKKPPLKKALSASKKKRKSAKKTLSVKARAAAPSKKAQSRRKKKPVSAAGATATKAPPKSAAKKPLKARSSSLAQAALADKAHKSVSRKKLSKNRNLKKPARGIRSSVKPPAFDRRFRFTMENVRCFEGRQTFEIRPLTFLVGENSTGKTSFMGCFHAFFSSDFLFLLDKFNFNEKPYEMGSFDTIVSRPKGKASQSDAFFELEASSSSRDPETKCAVRFEKDKTSARPMVREIKIFIKNVGKARFEFKNATFQCNFFPQKSAFAKLQPFSASVEATKYDHFSFHDRWSFPFFYMFREFLKKKKLNKEQAEWFEEIQRFLRRMERDFFRLSMAPVRSKPKRFYSSFMEEPGFDPAGGDTPMILRKISLQQNTKRWKELSSELKKFGRKTGLFDDIQIKELHAGNFEIHLTTPSAESNICDTGYGTSQILPVLTHLFLSPPGNRLLLQQPEVHLHPKAQAELSSLFVDCVKKPMNKSFLIETHSDYMVDRARTAVRKGLIPADDLSLIYLESRKGQVHAHSILFDEKGDMIKVPKGYRDFFLEEMDRVLGVED